MGRGRDLHTDRDRVLGCLPDVLAEGQQPRLCQRLAWRRLRRWGATVASGRLTVDATEAAGEVVGVGKAAVVGDGGHAEVAPGEQRGGAGQTQQLLGSQTAGNM